MNKYLENTIKNLKQENQKLTIQIQNLKIKNKEMKSKLSEVMEKLKKKTKRERPQDVQKYLDDISFQMSRYIETKTWRGTASIEEARNQVVQEMKNIQTAFTRKFGIKTNQRHRYSAWRGGTTIRPCPKINSDDQDFQNSNDDVSKIISIIQEMIDTDKNKKDLEKSRDIISNLPLPNTDDIEQNIREKLKLNNDKIKQNEKEYPYIAPIGTQTKEDEEDIEDEEENEEEDEDDQVVIDNSLNETVKGLEHNDDINTLLKDTSVSDDNFPKIIGKNNQNLKKEIKLLDSIKEKYESMLDIKDVLKVKGDSLQTGGRKSLAAEELYNKVIFRKDGSIKKLNLKKNRHRKKVHKIVNNLLKIFNKSKGGATVEEKRLQHGLFEGYEERIPNIEKYKTFLDTKNEIYEKNKQNFKDTNFKTYDFSMGEISHYERILTNIIDSWKKCGLKDMNDKIYNDIVILLTDIEGLKTVDDQQTKLEDERKINDSLKFFEDPNYFIFTDSDEQIKAKKRELKVKMKLQYMSNENYNKLIEFLIRLYNEKYIMIIRYQKLFSKLKQYQEIKPTSSFKINRQSKDILQGDFLLFLSLIKKELDEYLVLTRRPVSIYARINDIGRFERHSEDKGIIQDFNIAKQECSKITNWDKDKEYKRGDMVMKAVNLKDKDLINAKFCDLINPTDFIQWSENKINSGFLDVVSGDGNYTCEHDLENGNMLKHANNVKFSEIFFRPEFNDNATISQYMLLDKLITRDIGTYLFTYGYSGVGKSYTLFGSKGVDGLLQSTITNIVTKGESKKLESIKLRIYELYGLGVGYSECWSDYNKIDQSIFEYSIGKSAKDNDLQIMELSEKRGKYIPEYMQAQKRALLKKNQTNGKILDNFSELVSEIDKYRTDGNSTSSDMKYPKRIKETINNPVSSRGKLVYDFLFKFEDETETPFIIDDSPGAENLLESYIYNNTEINKNTLDEIKDNKNDPTKIVDKKVSWEFAMLCAVLVQPLMLGFLNANGVILGYNKMSLNLFKRRQKRIDDYLNHMGGIVSLKPKKINPGDYCQKMYKQYEMKVIMDYISKKKFVKDEDKELYKNGILNEQMSFYVENINTEQDNMKFASKLISKTITYCIDIEDIDIKDGESKYDLLIDLLTNIFELSNIFLESGKAEDISKEIEGDVAKFKKLWVKQGKDIKNASYNSFYKEWVKYFNKNVIDIERTGQHLPDKKWQTTNWEVSMDSVKDFDNLRGKYNDGDSWNIIFLGKSGGPIFSKGNAVKNVFSKITSNHLKELHTHYDKSTDDRKPEFINYLIKNKLVGEDLINNWVSELEKTISNRDATKVTSVQIDETRETIRNLITLSMESWYINQNIAGILRKCSQASGIPENDIENDIVLYNDYSLESSFEYIKNNYITKSHYDELIRTNDIIKYCQDDYKPNKLFKVEKFPENIINFNRQAKDKFRNDTQEFNTIKMDTIVSVLMEPYLSKNNKSSIEDFKMFYVLQNNKTKLKCYDQLRTFSMFTNFINKVIPTE